MGISIKEHRNMFLAIANGPEDNELRKDFLKPLSRKQVKAIAELAVNVLYGTIGLSKIKKQKLRPIRPFLRSLSKEDIGATLRKKIILSHPAETFLLISTVLRNLEDLIWHD